MNAAQVHLALNHLPLFAFLFGLPLALYGFLRGAAAVRQVGLGLIVVGALGAIPVFLSGEPTEEVVEHRAGVSEAVIHEHEEAAELAIWVVEIAGAAALALLVWLRLGRSVPVAGWAAALLLAFAAWAALARVSHLGGLIRHDELRGESPPAASLTP